MTDNGETSTVTTSDYLDQFVAAYVECALWSSIDYVEDDDKGERGEPLDANYGPDDVANMDDVRAECAAFIADQAANLEGLDAGQCGHDFWLTRCHHGAGFWDRGLGELGDRLTAACRPYGEGNAYVGDDGRVYIEG